MQRSQTENSYPQPTTLPLFSSDTPQNTSEDEISRELLSRMLVLPPPPQALAWARQALVAAQWMLHLGLQLPALLYHLAAALVSVLGARSLQALLPRLHPLLWRLVPARVVALAQRPHPLGWTLPEEVALVAVAQVRCWSSPAIHTHTLPLPLNSTRKRREVSNHQLLPLLLMTQPTCLACLCVPPAQVFKHTDFAAWRAGFHLLAWAQVCGDVDGPIVAGRE